MEINRNTLSVVVSGLFVGSIGGYGPAAIAGFEIVGNPNTPYVYQIAATPRPAIDVREERVYGSTANIIHQGIVNVEMALIPVAGNRGVEMVSGLRGIIPESQDWRVFSLRGIDQRKKIDWTGSESWVLSLDGVLLKNKLIAEINWETREITLAPFFNKTYSKRLSLQQRDKSVLRQVKINKRYESTSEPLIALRLHPAQGGIAEGRTVPVASIEVPVRTLSEIGESKGRINADEKVSSDPMDSIINERVAQATRKRFEQLQALEAHYRAKLAQIDAQNKQVPAESSIAGKEEIVPVPPVSPSKSKVPNPDGHTPKAVIPISASPSSKPVSEDAEPVNAGFKMMHIGLATPRLSSQAERNTDRNITPASPWHKTALAASTEQPSPDIATLANGADVVSIPVQTPIEVVEHPRTKWEITVKDKTLRNALQRIGARNGFSLAYQTKDQEIKNGGTFFGTFQEVLRELELATGKRIQQVESRLLGRILFVTD